MKKITIKDISEKLGISPASISMILNGKNLPRFSEETIQNVYQTSRELGYVPKKQRKYKNAKKIILIICPSVMNPYFCTLTQSMEQEARLQGYTTLIFTTYWNKASEREILEMAEEPNIAGVIFAMIPQQPHLAEEVSKRIPMVAVGDPNCALQIDTVDVNNYQAARQIAFHLIELGHQHIAYISSTLSDDHSSRVRRCNGLQDVYQECCPEGSVTVFAQEVSHQKELHVTDVEHEVGFSLAQKCLAEAPHVTAIVAINDMVAYGARNGLLHAGKRIPEDISLCGFDNIWPSRFLDIELTTIEHRILERGRSSVRLLIEKLRGTSDLAEEHAFTRVEYQSQLIAGRTTGPARKPSIP